MREPQANRAVKLRSFSGLRAAASVLFRVVTHDAEVVARAK